MITKDQIYALESYWIADTILSVQEVAEITLALIAEWRERQPEDDATLCRGCGEKFEHHTDGKCPVGDGNFRTIQEPVNPRGDWVSERGSGFLGYRCTKCATWVYDFDYEAGNARCQCDESVKRS